MQNLLIPASIGELIDKITILEIKLQQLTGPAQANVARELQLLNDVLESSGLPIDDNWQRELRAVNEALWTIEDRIREHEHRQDFGESFIELARSVYRTNDRRSAVKRRINEAYGSAIIEEKLYQNYS